MANPSTQELTQVARQSGYHVVAVEQLRSNRWLLTLNDEAGSVILALIQARPLVSASDVQDMAEIVRLRRPERGFLVAYGGSFSAAAQRTFAELASSRLKLCTALPPAARQDGETRSVGTALKPIR
jgi:hypothetical protein